MTRKHLVPLMVFALALSVVFGATSFARDKGAAEMTLKAETGKKPALFNHAKHQETNKCETCHHYQDEAGKQVPCADEDAPIQKCSTCHNTEFKDPKLNSFKAAAHKLCKDCHKKVSAEGKAAPTKCDGCHPKK